MVFWLIIFAFRLCYRKKNIWELVWERSLLFILNDDQVHSTFLQEEPITSSFVLRDFAINHLCIRGAVTREKKNNVFMLFGQIKYEQFVPSWNQKRTYTS